MDVKTNIDEASQRILHFKVNLAGKQSEQYRFSSWELQAYDENPPP